MLAIEYQAKTQVDHDGWAVPHADGTFRFEFAAVLKAYRALVCTELPHIHMGSRASGAYAEYVQALEALVWLERKWLSDYKNDVQEVVPWPPHLGHLWFTCARLFIAKQFLSATCPSCASTYSPDQIEARSFEHGESMSAYGGTGLVCPKQHSIYVIVSWNS